MQEDASQTKTIKRKRTTPCWSIWKQRPNCHLADAVAISLNLHPSALASLKKKKSPRYMNYLARLKTASLSTGPNGPINEVPNHPESGEDPYYRIVALASFVDFATKQETWREKLPQEFLLLGSKQTAENNEQTLPTRLIVDDLTQQNILPPADDSEIAVDDSTTRLSVDSGTAIKDTNGRTNRGDSSILATNQIDKELTTEADSSNQVTVTLPHTTKMLEAFFQVMREQWADSDRPPPQWMIAHEIDKALGFNPQKNGDASRNGQVLSTIMRPDHLREGDRRATKKGL